MGEITKIRKRLDRLWSEITRSRNNGLCERCNSPANQAHHVIGRKNYNLRWDLRNGCLLCANCHWLQSYSAHVDPIGFIDEWFKFAREEDYKYLKAQKDKKINRTIFDYEELEKHLKEKLNEIR